MTSKFQLTHQPNSNEVVYSVNSLPILKIGKFSYSGNISIVVYDSPPPLSEIGNYCSIADEVQFLLVRNHAYDYVTSYPMFHHCMELTNPGEAYYRDTKVQSNVAKLRIIVGSDVWIGRGATILPGIKIGHGAVIGAMAVVSKDVPPYAIVAGNPGKIIKYRFSENQISRLLKIKWWEWKHEDIVKYVYQFMSSDIDGFIRKHDV